MDKFLNIKKFLLDLFFPKFCLGCQKEGTYLCDDCRELLDICEYDYCLCSAYESIPPQRLPPNSKLGKCPKCHSKNLDGLYFALAYKEKPLTKKLIRQFKYAPYLKDLSATMASILVEHFIKTGKNASSIWQNSVLIPVPAHIKKIRERGYNQSEELAKEISKILNIPVISDVLVKTKPTASQAELKKEEREKNLLGAFKINCGASETPQFSGKKVFLVDDVYTTGSTMQECAKILKTAGAKSVWGIAIAREE